MIVLNRITTTLIIPLMLWGCIRKAEKESPGLISKVDGEAYFADMEGGMDARKAVRLIEEGNIDEISYNAILEISDSLIVMDSIWRARYFGSLNQVYHLLEGADLNKLEFNAFVFLLEYPKQCIQAIEKLPFSDSDFWIERLSDELHVNTSQDGITKISVVNLMLANCSDCEENDKDLFITFINVLDNYIKI